ncbi:phage integrase Arm DNA-binding domain-containing protein [Yersinia frederiksenii]|uniref:phage integrase Arm DNA-binding domain-containing protein n=1 Tax=Yersinia frederiksenii TaxID=29484 RepID=UPI0025AA5B23|nr:phage integrase Arm DNA-binding domain-containing protein [Yersinia frederiksenii]MDN0121564.1 phage integrase Arm DNA-binding domain-containing protein [Yersinia frederiksenii]
MTKLLTLEEWAQETYNSKPPITRRDAIAQAIEANNYIESNFQPVALLERLQAPTPTPTDPAVN